MLRVYNEVHGAGFSKAKVRALEVCRCRTNRGSLATLLYYPF
jgi:hypothetical protein